MGVREKHINNNNHTNKSFLFFWQKIICAKIISRKELRKLSTNWDGLRSSITISLSPWESLAMFGVCLGIPLTATLLIQNFSIIFLMYTLKLNNNKILIERILFYIR